MAMKSEKIRKLVTMAMLAALSIVLVYVVHFPIFPAAPFLEYDPADIPILIGTFAYGPVAGIILTVVVSVIQGMTVSASSGFMGIAMHIFATSILVLVAGNIYRLKHTKKGAVIALICGVAAMTAGMVVFNYFIPPTSLPLTSLTLLLWRPTGHFVKTLLVPVIIPFNLIKAGVNGLVTFLVYKTVSRHLVHGEGLGEAPQAEPGADRAVRTNPNRPASRRGEREKRRSSRRFSCFPWKGGLAVDRVIFTVT